MASDQAPVAVKEETKGSDGKVNISYIPASKRNRRAGSKKGADSTDYEKKRNEVNTLRLTSKLLAKVGCRLPLIFVTDYGKRGEGIVQQYCPRTFHL